MYKKIGTVQVLCVAGGVVLFLLAKWFTGAGGMEKNPYLPRNSYGQGDRSYDLEVEGLDEEVSSITVALAERQYTKKEADQVFDSIISNIGDRIRKDNPSLTEVRTDLDLITWLSEEGVKIRWSSEEPDLIDSFGHIRTGEIPKEGVSIYLNAYLSAGVHKAHYQISMKLYPPELSEKERLKEGLRCQIQTWDDLQKMKEGLQLPGEFQGKTLHYRVGTSSNSNYRALPILGILLAFLFYARDQKAAQDKKKKRSQELLSDYAEIVFKLKVFIGAGMAVSAAWENIVSDYERRLGQGRIKPRAAYEEMHDTRRQMECGVSEGQAYLDFGKRCQLQPYLKLSCLLEQNRKTGTRNLNNLLEAEMADAWEQKKAMARRLGEEAGTKLLLPLFLMLGIVMVIIMVPAMMSMK